MSAAFLKSLTASMPKGWNQRIVTLLSIFMIIISFSLLVAYNTVHKEDSSAQQASGDAPVTTGSGSETVRTQEIEVKMQAPVTATPAPAATELPAEVSAEQKAMSDLNDIKISEPAAQQQRGQITVDGSSMVSSITQLVADKYKDFYKNVQVTVGVAGTEEGMRDFAAGKLDICGTVRKMTAEEIAACESSGVKFVEIKLAYDAVAVVVNKGNSWVDAISMTELRKIWDSRGTARLWSDVNRSWPGNALKSFNSNTEALSQNFFCSALYSNGAAKLSRYNTTVEDNGVFLESMAGEPDAVGFCSYSTYAAHPDQLKALGILTANGPVPPSQDTIKTGAYTPLSRTLYIYANKSALQKEYVKGFVKVYIENVAKFVKAAGYLPCEDTEYNAAVESLNRP